MATKNYYTNESTHIKRGMEYMSDLGYSLEIPWNTIYTAGWQYKKPDIWGYERKLITKPDPEFWASGNTIRSNVMPEINIHNPIYSFDRSKWTYEI